MNNLFAESLFLLFLIISVAIVGISALAIMLFWVLIYAGIGLILLMAVLLMPLTAVGNCLKFLLDKCHLSDILEV